MPTGQEPECVEQSQLRHTPHTYRSLRGWVYVQLLEWLTTMNAWVRSEVKGRQLPDRPALDSLRFNREMQRGPLPPNRILA